MNRTMISVAALFSASSLLLVDSAVKGVALLSVAAAVAVILRRDSAATRHLVWLLALVAMLILPVLSANLPQWRVLPEWTSIVPVPAVVNVGPTRADTPELPTAGLPTAEVPTAEVPQPAHRVAEPEFPSPRELPAASSPRMTPPPLAAKPVDSAPLTGNWKWHDVLPLVWMIGFGLLVLRLAAARLSLRNSERQATVIWPSGRRAPATQDRLVAALEASRQHLGMRRPVRLLVHSRKTIPVVWGILQPRLLLPVTARDWSDEQLRSVLLHELAHIKRRDILAQLLAQMACALHWFNPLAWFAAWRLGVERERACDDLVLASGVRASAYAGHLLDVVSGHSPTRWAQSCGLTMARKSSLEGRLVAVLNQNLNRRCVTSAVAVAALALGTAVAIPVSMLHSAGGTTSQDPVAKKPLDASAYRGLDAALLNRWLALEGNARRIPESRVAGLRSAIGRFLAEIDASPFSVTSEQIAELKALQTRGAGKREHTTQAAEEFIQAVYAIHGEPVQMALNESAWPGTQRPVEELERLPFGPAAPNGLRAALSCGKERFVFGDIAQLDLHLWNTGDETLVVGIGSDAPGLYPKIDLLASGRDRRQIEATAGPEPEALAGIKFTKTWQLRPGESAQIFGYLLRVGAGPSREAANWPKWYSTMEILDVQSGEEVTLTARLPYPAVPGAPAVAAALQTGELKITATSPDDVAIWSARGASRWPMPGGVTLEVKEELVHAADIVTSAVLTWPKDSAGVTYAFTIGLAADAFGNRDPWHMVWEKESTVLWAMSGQMQSWKDFRKNLPTPVSVTRIDFSDKMRITRTTWGHQPEAMPAGVRAEFLTAFQPLPASPRNLVDVNSRVTIEQAHDVRPIEELLHGVWKNQEGQLDVRLTFPVRETDPIKWNVGFGRQVGASVVNANLRRIRSPANNAVKLWLPSNPAGFVDEQDILATLRRGPDDTLLLDIHERAKYPGNEAAQAIVLVRENAGAPPDTDVGDATATGPPASQPPQFPPPHREAVRGLDLTRVAVRRASEPHAHSPDLYIPDPEHPGSWTRPKNVFQMPLAEHIWLEYPAGSGHFYIRHRPDGTWQNEQLYGPMDGDPFEMLRLEELVREQLAPRESAGKAREWLRRMFRTGEPALVRRAVRLIEPELARQFEPDTVGLLNQVALLVMARAALHDEADAFRRSELSSELAALRQSIAAAESAIDKVNDSVPDADYQSVTHRQPQLGAEIPDKLWGRPVAGLRLALVPRDWTSDFDWNSLPLGTQLSASLTVRPGHEQRYQLLVENVSDQEIKLCGYVFGEDVERRLEVLDEQGEPVETRSLHTTAKRFRSYLRLKPGERQLLSMPEVHFETEARDPPDRHRGYTVKVTPGAYTLRCSIRFGRYDNTRHRHVPGQSEWIGELSTGSQSISVVDANAGSTDGLPIPDDEKINAEDTGLDQPSGFTNPGGAPQEPQEQKRGPQPMSKEAQALLKVWQGGARLSGNIPGGALGALARAAENFVMHNPTDERAPKIVELLKRIDVTRDWTPAEAVALLDEVTAVYASLPSWALDESRFTLGGAVQTGRPLPEELNSAPWGEAEPNGLRVAWLLEPQEAQYRLGTSLKSRLLFHNAGNRVILFRALNWNQSGAHKAQDAQGAEIRVTSTDWTTIPRIVACRLGPGEFLEMTAAGIGVGARELGEGGQSIRVGSWVLAKPGDEVTLTPGRVAVNGRRDEVRSDGDPGWWLEFIKDRLSRDMPLPADAAERRHLLDRAVGGLFGTPPTSEETAAFVSDASPEALDALADRLAQRADTSSFTGMLRSGTTQFRVAQ